MTLHQDPGLATSPRVLYYTARRHMVITAVATFALTVVIVSSFLLYLHREQVEARRLQARLHAQSYAQRIQDRLQSAFTATYVLSSLVRQSGGRLARFDDVATDIMANFPMVSAVQLAPDGVIAQIHPLAGNEAAMGHNLLKDRNRNREAHMAIATRQLTLAGPFELIQGGMGAVARMPVFLGGDSHGDFWGFAIVLIRIPNLLDTANIGELARAGYAYELWRQKPESEERFVFARRGDAAPDKPVEYSITVPNGRWMLAVAPEGGWIQPREYVELALISLAVAACVASLQLLGLQSYLRAVARARLT